MTTTKFNSVTYIGGNGHYVQVLSCDEFGNLTNDRLPLHLDQYNASPTGFSWGYEGSGPAQLAFCILYDFTGNLELAKRYTQRFKRTYIANLESNQNWTLRGDVLEGVIQSWEKGLIE
tara:strand:- start:13837 stop:14190 length:354 start_codon:yes stop_codon:yes gene_type:complete